MLAFSFLSAEVYDGMTLFSAYSDDPDEDEMDLLRQTKKPGEEGDNKSTLKLGDFSSEKLNDLLEKALENEDYERAAALRDELNRRN